MIEQKNSRPFTVAIYNPALLKKEDLIRGFVARQPLLNMLLEDLQREANGTTVQHHLIVGQRGFGKTTLLRRLAFAIEDTRNLTDAWIPLVFPEEQYNVASLGDFWLNCVDALSDALDRFGDHAASQQLDGCVENIPTSGPERSEAALQLLIHEANRLGRRILLLVDNIDIVLDRLAKGEDWEFRRVISEEGRLHFIGASNRILEALYQPEQAFYDFFQVHKLKGFDENETFSTLLHLAEQSGDVEVEKIVREQPGRIKALRVLTGGNPRTLVVMFKVLAQGPEGDVQRDIEQLLDEYTALYKARFEELAPQSQQVVDAMAIHWDPITAGELAEHLGPLNVNKVSAQLKRLQDFGVVEETESFGSKKKAFQIAERFFNIWYLMRSSRRVRRRLVWLVRFLEAWFDGKELSARATEFLKRKPDPIGREQFADMALAYAQTVPNRHLRRELERVGMREMLVERVSKLIDFSNLPPEPDDEESLTQQLQELRKRVCRLRVNWDGLEPIQLWRQLEPSNHFSWREKARIIEQLPLLSEPDLKELYGKLIWLHWEQLSEGEIKTAQLVLEAKAMEPEFEHVAWNSLGALKCRFAHYQEAEQAYRRAIELDAQYALCWSNLADLLQHHLRRYEEAEQAYRRAIDLDPQDAISWGNLGDLLQVHLKRYEEAEKAYRRAIELDQHDSYSWNGLGNLLQIHLKRYEEAEQAYLRAIELDPDNSHPWNGLGVLLYDHSERHEEAERAYHHAIELDPNNAYAWSNLGKLLAMDPERYRESAERFLRAFEIDPTRSGDLTRLIFVCDRLGESPKEFPATMKLVQRAHTLSPDHLDTQFVLARILTLSERWPEARALLEQLAANEASVYYVSFFRAAERKGHLDEVIKILESTGAHERWRPLYKALEAVQRGTSAYLRTVAPEIRTAAMQLLHFLKPSLSPYAEEGSYTDF